MTVFEYFKKQYDTEHDTMVERINPEIEVDSFQFVKVASEHFFGGTFHVEGPSHDIVGTTDTQEMLRKGFVKKSFDNSWLARQTGKTTNVYLTAKGLKAFYKEMF